MNVVIKYIICRINYFRKIKQLRKIYGKRKINVLFYVTENSKWGYQSLYETFAKNDFFKPLVLVSALRLHESNKNKLEKNIDENLKFFQTQNLDTKLGYKNGKFIDLREYNPDIIFYDQPWEIPQKHKPKNTSKFALTFYCPYGFQVFDYKSDYIESFHKMIFRNYIDSDINIQRYEMYKNGNSKNCIAVGYPKLDEYFNIKQIELEKLWKEPEKIKIIYAPHHSFEKDGISAATFKENGIAILEFAKAHPETTWIFKPHPRFKYAVVANNIMSRDEIEKYYVNWEQVGLIHTQGNYFDIFKTSDLMITDSCSFLAEYLPTMKPLIRFINPNVLSLNNLGKEIVKAHYEVNSFVEFQNIFRQLYVDKNDTKKDIRNKVLKHILDNDQKSAEKIIKNILDILEK